MRLRFWKLRVSWVDMMNPIDALKWRYATKQFDKSARLSDGEVAQLCEALVLTPSSFGLQPWQFLIVENVEIREKLRVESWGQPQITDASHLIVLTARDTMGAGEISAWVARLAEIQGIPVDALAGLKGMIEGFAEQKSAAEIRDWNDRQVYVALGQLMATAAQMGLDTCPLEGIDAGKYNEILGLQDSGFHTVVACAVGHRSVEDAYATRPKARFREDEVIRVIGS